MSEEDSSPDLAREEYKALRSAIEEATKAQLRVFTFSIVTAFSLLGLFLKFGNQSYSHLTINVFLVPVLIVLPSAYLVRNLRREIYRLGTFIQVFIERNNPMRYETALARIRDRYRSSEAFNPVFTTYWIATLCCAGLFGIASFESRITVRYWQLLSWAACIVLLANAHLSFSRVPSTERRLLLKQWRSIRDERRGRSAQNSAHDDSSPPNQLPQVPSERADA